MERMTEEQILAMAVLGLEVKLQQTRERLAELQGLKVATKAGKSHAGKPRTKAARARMSEAQRQRWARYHAQQRKAKQRK